jgi:hypothetical protein
MKTTTIAKTALGIGAALLVLTVAPGTIAYASPAVHVPCSGSGGGSAGLIAAITSANSSGGGTINLAEECTYKLSSPNNTKPMIGANGLPVVTSRITIKGDRTTIRRKTAAMDFRIFEVDGPGGKLTLQDLVITGGASPFAGGIFNDEGTVTLNRSQVTGNTALMGGGGIASGIGPDHSTDVGPIGTLTLNDSQVNDNTVVLGPMGGGGGILNRAGTLTLHDSQVNHNTSAGGGGGIASGIGNPFNLGSSTLVLNDSQVNNNTSTGGPTAGAGGIANGGTATITRSQVNNNTAPGADGGGILNHGTMTINLSQVNHNKAPKDLLGNEGSGGGIANLNAGVTNSGVLTVYLSQVNNNSASGMGGGILEAGISGFNPDGSFIFGAPGGPLALNHSEVTDNRSDSGGGIYTTAGSPVTLKHTFVGENHPDNCFPDGSISGCFD